MACRSYGNAIVRISGRESKACKVADFPDLDKRMVKLRVKLAIYKLSDGKPPA